MTESTKDTPQWVRSGSFEDPFKKSITNVMVLMADALKEKAKEMSKRNGAFNG